MPLIAVGCNHRSSTLEMLERMAVTPDDMAKALHDLMGSDHLSEAVVLSTCHRTEVYAFAERFHGGCADVREVLARNSGLPPEAVADEVYTHHDTAAVRHLFSVAAGLDSVVVGEHEVLGQVRGAWLTARAHGAVASTLERLFRRAVETGKRARADTAVGRGIASVSQAAVALAEAQLWGLAGRSVLVLGAGDAGTGTLRSLAAAGAADLSVVNRTWQRAQDAAALCGARAVPLAELESALVSADLLVTTTGATDIILEHSDVGSVMARRDGAPLLIIDVAVPRDVDPAARELTGVTLLDMDDLSAFVAQGLAGRALEVSRVRAIVRDEVERYEADSSARTVDPLVAALRARAERIGTHELARHESRLSELSEPQKAAVESLVRGVINKLMHEPTVRLKGAAGGPRGERLAESLRDLFDL